MALHPELIEILVCPTDHQSLWYLDDESVLFNPRLGRTYAVRDGIPNMIVEESTTLDADAAGRLQGLVDDGQAVATGN